jgi:hypothetical protein
VFVVGCLGCAVRGPSAPSVAKGASPPDATLNLPPLPSSVPVTATAPSASASAAPAPVPPAAPVALNEPAPDISTHYAGNDVVESPRQPGKDPLDAVCRGPAASCKCPDFSSFPEGTGRAWLLQRGSFAGPFHEALVTLMMCGAHSENFGGTVLVRQLPVGWLPIGYVPGFVPRSCTAHRGPDGLDRLACFESYGLNQGTYNTSASVVDFAAKHYDLLLSGECEDARDVRSVRWASSTAQNFDVNVVIERGEKRDNIDSACRTVSGSPFPSTASYVFSASGYAPTPKTEKLLWSLVPPPSDPIDPTVAAAVITPPAQTLAHELRPARQDLDLRSISTDTN